MDNGATLRRTRRAVPELSAVLPAYTIGEPIGRGTFGLVYAARHVALRRDVAIKRLWPDLVADSDARLRFGAEAGVLAALDHPNIVRVYDYVEENLFAIVLERMRGGTLHALLRGGPVSSKSACAITLAVLDALEHAHRRGVLHRDVKPQNVMFGEQGQVKLADFGLAKVCGTDWTSITNTSPQPGTPAYMAPEQVSQSLGPVSPKTDVWAAGAVLYEMLAGRRVDGDVLAPAEMLFRRAFGELRAVADLAPHIPAALSGVVDKALARLPADRFATAAEFAQSLERAARETEPRHKLCYK